MCMCLCVCVTERTGGEVTGSLVGSFSKDPRGMYLPENGHNLRTRQQEYNVV